MKDTGSFNGAKDGYYNNAVYDNSDNENQHPYKKKSSIDVNSNDIYQNQNSNYRQVFKPKPQQDDYDRMPMDSYDPYDSIQKEMKNNKLNQVNRNFASRPGNQLSEFDEDTNSGLRVGSNTKNGITKKPPLSNKPTSLNFNRDLDEDVSSGKFPSKLLRGGLNREGDKVESPINANSRLRQKTGGLGNKGIKKEFDNSIYEPPPIESNPMKNKNSGGFGGNNSAENNKINQNNQQSTRSNKNSNYGIGNKNKIPAEEDNYIGSNSRISSKPSPMGSKMNSNFNNQRNNPIDDIPIPTMAKKQNNLREFDDEMPEEEDLFECPEGCGRKFNSQVIEKHATVCKKVFQSKRKKFDSSAARMTEDQSQLQGNPGGTNGGARGGSQLKSKQSQKSKKYDEQPVKGDKKNKWKSQSESFRAGLRAARGEKLTVQEEKQLAKAAQDDFVHCDYCGRNFGENAALRHIPYCENKSKLNKIKQGGKSTIGGMKSIGPESRSSYGNNPGKNMNSNYNKSSARKY